MNNVWKVIRNMGHYQVARQIRPLRYGEPFHSGVIETQGWFDNRAEAQELADKLNRKKMTK